MGKLWAIILAAGESKRMGFPKMLLPFRGKTMIENVIANISESKADNIMVVLGAEQESIIRLIGEMSLEYCFNDSYREGMLSSVVCGFRNLPLNLSAVLVFQGDQPLITPIAINTVIEAYLSSGKGIIIPVYRSRRGHPILIDNKYRNEIGKLSSVKGLCSLAEKFHDDVLEVNTNEPGILRDFDTYTEYLEEINQMR
jgi:molybdenum cofactor cytidylyltransferase